LAARRAEATNVVQSEAEREKLWSEKLEREAIIREASDAALASAPPELPPIRDLDRGSGIGMLGGSVCYVFESDVGLALARERMLTDWLDAETKRELERRHYPAEGLAEFTVRFCTHEEILRKTGGNYYQFFR
jgi:hypothetical protein